MPAIRAGKSRADARPDVVIDLDNLPRPRPPVHDTEPDPRWPARPVLAAVVRGVAVLAPVAASVVCAALLSRALPRATTWPGAVFWWVVVLAASTSTLVLVDRLARRFLPLALLLRLTMAFPDRAPSRYRVAARSWNSRRVRADVERARAEGQSDSATEAASRILALLGNLAIHDRRTRGHCERVRAYNDLLATQLGLSDPDRDRLRWAALIHDIGKLAVPRRVLNKSAEPSDDEWHLLRAHPARGSEIAEPLADWLGPWSAAIEQHHERWDGSGYPHGLAGTDINLGARIVAVADAFEVMTSARPYGLPVSAQAAREELTSCAGTQFDPVVVRAFLNLSLGSLRRVMGPLSWLVQLPFLAQMPRFEAAVSEASRQAVTTAGAVAGAGTVAGVVAVSTLGGPAPQHHHHAGTDAARARPVAAHTHVDGSASDTAPAVTAPTHAPAPTTAPARRTTHSSRAGHRRHHPHGGPSAQATHGNAHLPGDQGMSAAHRQDGSHANSGQGGSAVAGHDPATGTGMGADHAAAHARGHGVGLTGGMPPGQDVQCAVDATGTAMTHGHGHGHGVDPLDDCS